MSRYAEDDPAATQPRPTAGEAEAPRRPLGPGRVLAAALALVVSAALAWWFGTQGGERPPADIPPPAVARTTRVYAPPSADPAQVRRAYEQVQETFADSGRDGLDRYAADCVKTLEADPRVLDFCMAVDMYAAVLAGRPGDASAAEQRRMQLVQAALPNGADPQARLAQVRAIMRRISLASTGAQTAAAAAPKAASAPAAEASARAAPVEPRAHPATAAKPAHRHAAAKPRHKSHRAAASHAVHHAHAPRDCRLRSTPAAREVCASASLRAADARMHRAYRAAQAAGANRQQLTEAQARWRVALDQAAPDRRALARLYAERTSQLREVAARRR